MDPNPFVWTGVDMGDSVVFCHADKINHIPGQWLTLDVLKRPAIGELTGKAHSNAKGPAPRLRQKEWFVQPEAGLLEFRTH